MWHLGVMENQYPSLGQYSTPEHKERVFNILKTLLEGAKLWLRGVADN
jgi:hypothetical protein